MADRFDMSAPPAVHSAAPEERQVLTQLVESEPQALRACRLCDYRVCPVGVCPVGIALEAAVVAGNAPD